ncbi:hypothetical protein AVEN_115980-1 [Araneus ventricosus]|uniref:Reverse transcriptase domain-containing protein n=1 Tax=Araneus ventricosus TaxID=182803 RepID=A0A4Y2L8N0_ARAVE|nr:hypothetical protein AVEN_115980-1 [Araneus ventricosus]
MDLECKELSSFKTHRQQYQFKVMSFGLKNASATFQRVINRALSQYRNFSRAYIDDTAVYSDNWEEHMIHSMQTSRIKLCCQSEEVLVCEVSHKIFGPCRCLGSAST